jgi:hypothetical protein
MPLLKLTQLNVLQSIAAGNRLNYQTSSGEPLSLPIVQTTLLAQTRLSALAGSRL